MDELLLDELFDNAISPHNSGNTSFLSVKQKFLDFEHIRNAFSVRRKYSYYNNDIQSAVDNSLASTSRCRGRPGAVRSYTLQPVNPFRPLWITLILFVVKQPFEPIPPALHFVAPMAM